MKAAPEDFEVEELPAYEPCGEGEHLFLWVEKRGLSTPEAAKVLARHLGVPEREVSWAGLKDRQAVARQWMCVPARGAGRAEGLEHPSLRVLRAERHRNKLRSGHLRGNRFSLRIRGAREPGAVREVLSALAAAGVPNYFGEQRFGREAKNAEMGKALLLGGPAAARTDRLRRKLYLSAFQSLLFNRALAARVRSGTMARVLLGDVLKRGDSGGEFVCRDVSADQPRVDRFEVSPSGPLFGPKMLPAASEVAEAEAELLAEEGVRLEDFARGGGETKGGRRPYRVRLEEPEASEDGSDLLIRFALPAGSYATVVMRELMK